MKEAHDADQLGDIEELKKYAMEFLADVDAAYPPNTAVTVPPLAADTAHELVGTEIKEDGK